jgi:uncharacterized membrane protein YdjX (TVP38/TMEM64 family)
MDWLQSLVAELSRVGRWGPVLFVALYVVAAVTLAPAFVLTFAAGAVYGLWRGTLLVFVGATLGSSVVYALAVPLARTRVLRWIDRDPRIAAARQAVVDHSAWIQFLLRLSPLVPYNLLNYTLALSGVKYRDFLIASVGMLPAIIMYAYYGKVVGDVARIAVGVQPPRGPEYYVLLGIGLVATVVATTLITKAAKRAMDEASGKSDDPNPKSPTPKPNSDLG